MKLCLTLCDPMNFSRPVFPVLLHCLPELAQTHVHCVGDAIQASHPLVPFSSCLQSFPASGSFPMSGVFASGGQSIEVSVSTLSMNIQGWFPLGETAVPQRYILYIIYIYLWIFCIWGIVRHLSGLCKYWINKLIRKRPRKSTLNRVCPRLPLSR